MKLRKIATNAPGIALVCIVTLVCCVALARYIDFDNSTNETTSTVEFKGTSVSINDGPDLDTDDNGYIDAAAIGAGGMTDAEFAFLATVTSDVQTQIGAKQESHAALDDIVAISHVDGGVIVSDGANWGVETGVVLRTSIGLGVLTWSESESTLANDYAMRLGTTTDTTAGNMRWTGADLEVYDGGWVSLTAGAAGGEVNTASDVGAAGVAVFKQKTALDLEFNSINTGNSAISVALDAGNNEVDISGIRVGVYRTLYIDAGAFSSRTTNGMDGLNEEEYAANDIMSDYFLADPDTDEAVQVRYMMPDEWDLGTVKAKVHWTTETAANSVVWGVRAIAISNDDPLDVALGTPQTVTDAVIATGDLHTTAATAALTVGGTPALGDLTVFEVYRDADNGSDDNTGDAKLLGISIQYLELTTEPSIW